MRVGYLGFIARHALRWDLAMAALAAIFVAFGVAGERVGGSVGDLLLAAQWMLTFLFIAEYGTRLAASTDRRSYLIGHPFELVALAPPLRAVRVLALLRWLGIPAFGRRLSARLTLLSARARRSARYLLTGLWVILVFLGVAMLYQYTGSSPKGVDRLLAIAAGAFVVCLISAVTAVLTTSILMGRRAGLDDLTKRVRVLADMKDAGLLTADELVVERASMLRELNNPTDRVPPSRGVPSTQRGRSADSARSARDIALAARQLGRRQGLEGHQHRSIPRPRLGLGH